MGVWKQISSARTKDLTDFCRCLSCQIVSATVKVASRERRRKNELVSAPVSTVVEH